MSLHGMLIATAKAHPGKTAFHVPGDGGWGAITYGEFLGMSASACALLKTERAGKGARVAIVAENRPEWCAFYMGTLMAGAVAVPVDMRLTPGEIRNILEHSGAGAVVVSGKSAGAVGEASPGLDVRLIDMDAVPLEREASELKYEEADGEDLASLIYTSGTTGAPKGVMLTHGNLCSDAEAVTRVKLIGASDNVLSALPLHHTYPFMCTFVLPLMLGGSVTYPRSIKGEDIAEAVRATGVTSIVAVPLMLELMRDRIYSRLREAPLGGAVISAVRLFGWLRERSGVNLGRLFFGGRLGRQFRFFASGGARLEPRVMRDMEALGFTVVEGYGLTETAPIVTFNPLEKRKPGSAGRAVEGVEIKIMNPDERGVGEVAIRGPMVMKGYYRNPEATASAIKDGWFYSGDLGYLDREGYLFITGRAKEVIVLASGKNVYPEDVEKLYSSRIPLIKEMCVLAVEGRLHAVVVPDKEKAREAGFEEALRNELRKVSEEIASHMRISGYTLTEGPLPRTPLGKLRRFMVADIVSGKKMEKEEDPSLRDELSQRILKCLRPLSEEKGPVRSTDDLELDLGLDSLKRLELVSSLEKEFSIRLPDGFANEARTVGEVVSRIREGGVKEEGAEEALWEEPSEEEKRRAGLARRPFEWPVSAASALLLRALFKVFFGLEAKGVENIPEPPFIIAPNHASNLDGLVVASAVPLRTFRRLYFQGYYRYFEGPFKSLFGRLSHVIPIDTRGRLSGAMRVSHHVLKRGDAMCIFPEGQRSFDGELGEFKKGIGMLALKLDIPVVPAKIEGTFAVLPRGRWVPRPGKVKISFGEAVRPSSLDYSVRRKGADEAEHFSEVLRERVRRL